MTTRIGAPQELAAESGGGDGGLDGPEWHLDADLVIFRQFDGQPTEFSTSLPRLRAIA